MTCLRLPNLCLCDIGQPLERQAVTGETADGESAPDKLSGFSPELVVAQRKLEQFRAAFRADHIKRQPTSVQDGRFIPPDFQQVHTARPNSKRSAGFRDDCVPLFLPPHLGWHSNRVTNIYRRALHNQTRNACPPPSTPENKTDNRRGAPYARP